MILKKIIGINIRKMKYFCVACSYFNNYYKYAFVDGRCKTYKQYEASITRWYHTIEKGLAYKDYRAGFGKDNIDILITSMEEYSKKYDVTAFFYQTAMSTLNEYVRKNEEFGYIDEELNRRILNLPGKSNECGGTMEFIPLTRAELEHANFEIYSKNRHSIRDFSESPVDMKNIEVAIELAQYTPSACNRQGWKTYIIKEKQILKDVLQYQNGNRGFGHKFDKLILITGDLQCFNRERELHQVFIDGGMYAMRVLDSLFYKGIATVPLSASLTKEQEIRVRQLLNIDHSEVLIMFIGIGNYPEQCQTTRSERRPSEYTVI